MTSFFSMKSTLVVVLLCAIVRCSAWADTAPVSADFCRISLFFANELAWLGASFEENCYGDNLPPPQLYTEDIRAEIASILSTARSWQVKMKAISDKYQNAKLPAVDPSDMRQVAEASAQMTPLRYRMQMVQRQIRITEKLMHSKQPPEPTSERAPKEAQLGR